MKSLKSRILSIITAVALVISGIAISESSQIKADPQYATKPGKIMVSMGDSYSAGEGITPFYGAQDGQGNDYEKSVKVNSDDWLAHRSTLSWPGRLKLNGYDENKLMKDFKSDLSENDIAGKSWFFVAASGADTTSISGEQTRNYQVGDTPGSRNLPAQIDIFEKINNTYGPNSVDFVTISIGGNDVGFTELMTSAVLDDADTLQTLINSKLSLYDTSIKAKIKQVYKDIEAAAGKQATIIVAGYPRLMKAAGYTVPIKVNVTNFSMTNYSYDMPVNEEKCGKINQAVDDFNLKLSQLVYECRSEGMNIYFSSVTNAFNNHEAGTDEPYITIMNADDGHDDLINPNMDIDVDVDFTQYPTIVLNSYTINELQISASSMHPNSQGAIAYANAVQDVINQRDRNPIFYIDKDQSIKKNTVYQSVTASDTELDNDWYVVSSNTTISNRIIVKGNVNLILLDGKTLTTKGFDITAGSKLNIYAGNTSDTISGTGKLYAGYNGTVVTCDTYKAGIFVAPAMDSKSAAKLTIYGGNVTVAAGSTAGVEAIGARNGNDSGDFEIASGYEAVVTAGTSSSTAVPVVETRTGFTDRVAACCNNKFVSIEKCVSHKYTPTDAQYHTGPCIYCLHSASSEAHSFSGDSCTACSFAKTTINPTLSISGWTYGEAAVTPSVSGNSGAGTVSYTYYKDAACIEKTSAAQGSSASGEIPEYAGTYYVKADIQEAYTTDKIYKASSVSGSFTIAPKNITVTAESGEMTYGETEHAHTATIDGLVPGDSESLITYSVSSASGSNTGLYDIIPSGDEYQYHNNYRVTYVNGQFKINPLDVTVNITGQQSVTIYDKSEHRVTGYDFESSSPLYTENDFEFSGTAEATRTELGTTYMGLESSQFTNKNGNFNVTFNVTDGYETIAPVGTVYVEITGNKDSVIYDGKEHTVKGYTVKISDASYTESDFTFTGSDEVSLTNAGSKEMGLAASQFVNKNSGFNNVIFKVTDGKITVNPKDITVQADNASKTYGDSDPAFTAKISGLIKEEDKSGIVYSFGRKEGENVGKYDITVNGKENQGNYKVKFTNGTLTINPKEVTVSADNKEIIEGEAEPELTATIKGLVKGDAESLIKFTITRVAGITAGKYEIAVTGEEYQGNYQIKYEKGTFTIKAKDPDNNKGTDENKTETDENNKAAEDNKNETEENNKTNEYESSYTNSAVLDYYSNPRVTTPTVTTVEVTLKTPEGTKTVLNTDGSRTTTTVTESKDGTRLTSIITETADGTVISSSTEERPDGSTVESEMIIQKNGEMDSKEIETDSEGHIISTTVKKAVVDTEGTRTTVIAVVKAGGYFMEETINEYVSGKTSVNMRIVEEDKTVKEINQVINANGSEKVTSLITNPKGKQVLQSSTTDSNNNQTVSTYDVKNGKLKLKSVVSDKTSVTIPSTVKFNGTTYPVTTILKGTFSNAENIEKVILGENIKYIYAGAFENAENLNKIVFKNASVKKIQEGAFDGIPEDATIRIYTESKKAFKKLVNKINASGVANTVKFERKNPKKK